ncbi:MAG: hypothetical protein EOO93_31295 [Pedobacter sp.]|nr:MAG: hypothetical protein EOO93_31295 [Pedobacter sp.]
MANFCILLNVATYRYVFEPFLRRRHLIMPVLFMGNKVAVYICRKSVVELLQGMMLGEIDGNSEVVSAFNTKQIVGHPYSLKTGGYIQRNSFLFSN